MNGRKAWVVTLFAALQYLFNFFPTITQHNILNVWYVNGIGYNHDFVNVGIVFKCVEGMFDYHLARHLKELFGRAES